ncbi:mitochondrial inner membrane translocase subunit Tim17/Tim22/Tim23/peroxisomal protein PMP24 [Chytridium lagenaria]|nr:mitochondrial inner membrane translocase subunit Tim17/Tim22/Tim23/peroxisomal protein PMP24 [Chytridium lagenaria]
MLIQSLMESCPVKSGAALGGGFVLGGLFGMFMSSVDYGHNEEYLKLSTKEQMKITVRDMATKSYSSAKNFAVVGAIFAGTECVIESYRAKNDIYNGVAAGCLTGAALSAKAGPKVMLGGCLSFAAFSAAIEVWMRS